MIAILCPTRGRPEQCRRMVESAKATSEDNGNHVVVCLDFNNDDPLLPEYAEHFGDDVLNHNCPGMMPTSFRWNMLADNLMKDTNTKLFMLGADDMVFETECWDKALIDHYNALENKIHVYALQDSRDVDGTPHVIVTREYIEAMGYFVPPIFLHWFVDSWTVEIAKANRCFTHLRDFTLRHDKPSDQGKPDETHSRIRQWGWAERDKYVSEKMAHVLEAEKLRLAVALGNAVVIK